ncbi:hypothetical protein Tco_0429592 [Tanacetum coccineum]
MASNQAIKYAPQCGDLAVESLVFQTNNVVGNFNYPPTILAYKTIYKLLMNCPLRTAFMKCPSALYQNFFREFWCTAIAYDPNLSTDENKPRLLKEFLIKFTVMNGKKPLTLDFNTFTTSIGLDYSNGAYVAYPSIKVVKAELAKIVLGENYSSTEQVNSIQQLITYSLITGTKVDIGDIIYSDLVTKLLNRSRLRHVSYPRFISCALEALLGLESIQDENFWYLPGILSNSNFSKDPSKVTEIKLTAHMIAVNNQKDSVSPPPLSAKKKKGKWTDAKYQANQTQLARLRYRSLTKNKGKTSSEVEPDIEALQLKTFADVQALLLSDDEMVQENKLEYSPVQETDESTSNSIPGLKKFDNILKLIERQLVKYLRKNVVMENPTLHKKVIEAIEAYTKNSNDLLTLIKNFDFQGLKSSVASLQATATSQDKHLAELVKSSTSIAWNIGSKMTAIELSQAIIKTEFSSLRQDTSDIKSMMTKIYKSFKSQSSAPSSNVPKTTLAIFISK